MIRTIRIRFDPHTHYLLWFRVTTVQGDQSTYELSAPEPDAKIPPGIFRYDNR